MSNSESPFFRYSLLLREIDNLRFADDVSTVALLLVKIDGLGEINERFGFLGGDKVLEEMASRIGDVAREQDQSLRIAGASFALLIHNPIDESHAILAAQKIAKSTASPVPMGTGLARVKAHVGISVLPDSAGDAETLLRQCQAAQADARTDDEPYKLFELEANPTSNSSTHINFDLTRALDDGQMELFYQPKIALASKQLVGAEALLRWHSPRSGTVSPDYFLSTVETTHGRRKLFWFVLNSGLRCAAEWIERIPKFSLSVNVAADNLQDPDLPEIVDNVLKIWNVPAERLLFEINETTFTYDAGANADMLNRLRDIGVRIAIDNFGAGYSNLVCLKDLPADELKIDNAFIGPLVTDETDRQIVQSIIQLAHAVDLDAVAQGVEEPDALEILRAMGCDFAQGYEIGRPMPAGQFATEWIETVSPKKPLASPA